jgi:hypothetical protein
VRVSHGLVDTDDLDPFTSISRLFSVPCDQVETLSTCSSMLRDLERTAHSTRPGLLRPQQSQGNAPTGRHSPFQETRGKDN